jgi:5-formyltetrahydrofolate cyclo-ligase
VAHECQQVDRLALASWDIRLGAVVTDRRWHG